jgi:lipoyl-dependent peroxiredoxin
MGHLEARATVRWSGWTGTVTGGSGALAAPTATQLELGGPGSGTNPEELLAAAHANCFTSTLTAMARARDIVLDDVATSVTTRLAWDDDGHDHRLASSTLSLQIRSGAPEDAIRELVQEAEKRCPVCRALAGNVPMTVSLEIERSD